MVLPRSPSPSAARAPKSKQEQRRESPLRPNGAPRAHSPPTAAHCGPRRPPPSAALRPPSARPLAHHYPSFAAPSGKRPRPRQPSLRACAMAAAAHGRALELNGANHAPALASYWSSRFGQQSRLFSVRAECW